MNTRTLGIALMVLGGVAAVAAFGLPGLLSDEDLGMAVRSRDDGFERPELADDDELRPSVHVEVSEHMFSPMAFGTIGTHTFKVENRGKSPLELRRGPTSCTCTKAEIESPTVPPGGSTNITLEWEANTANDEFSQTARFYTNDPARPFIELSVTGAVTSPVMIEPTDIMLSSFASREGKTADAFVYTRFDRVPRVTKVNFHNQGLAPFFEFEYLPVDVGDVPAGFKSGMRIRAHIKPGLPYGGFEQIAMLETDSKDSPVWRLAYYGTVEGDISLVGPKWDSKRGVLRLGKIDAATGASTQLKLIVRGPDRDKISFGKPRSTSDALRITLGQPEQVEGSTIVQASLTIDVAPQTAEVSHMGSPADPLADLFIPTSSEREGELHVRVQFAVVGG